MNQILERYLLYIFFFFSKQTGRGNLYFVWVLHPFLRLTEVNFLVFFPTEICEFYEANQKK